MQKYGTAQLSTFMSGQRSFAICSRISMFVIRVPSSPLSFIPYYRTISHIPLSRYSPCRFLRSMLVSCVKNAIRSLQYFSYFMPQPLPTIGQLRSKESEQTIFAHYSGSFSMMHLMKLEKCFLSVFSSSITNPTSIKMTSTLRLSFCCSSLDQSSSLLLSKQRDLAISDQPLSFTSIFSNHRKLRQTMSKHLSNTVNFLSMMRTIIFPPWQSAWMKLYFMNISKKVIPPIRAIVLFSRCRCRSKYVIGFPSINVYTRIEGTEISQMGCGKCTSLCSTNNSLNVFRFCTYIVKSSWFVNVFLSADLVIGNQNPDHIRERIALAPKRISMSLAISGPMLGWRTLTATLQPLYWASQTWLIEPEAMGTGLNFSKISLTSFPNSAWKVLAVSSNLWPGACSLRCMNLIAIFSPMMSLR